MSGDVHPLAIVSLGASLVAYGISFFGTPLLLWFAVGAALVAIVCGHLAKNAIEAAPATRGGKAIAIAGLSSGYGYLALVLGILMLLRNAAPPS